MCHTNRTAKMPAGLTPAPRGNLGYVRVRNHSPRYCFYTVSGRGVIARLCTLLLANQNALFSRSEATYVIRKRIRSEPHENLNSLASNGPCVTLSTVRTGRNVTPTRARGPSFKHEVDLLTKSWVKTPLTMTTPIGTALGTLNGVQDGVRWRCPQTAL